MDDDFSPPVPSAPEESNSRILAAFYRLVAPAAPPAHAPLEQREIVRRARIIALVMLLSLFLAGIPLAGSPLGTLVPGILTVLAFGCVAIWFNRRGRITVAGWLLVLSSEIGLLINMYQLIQEEGGITFRVIAFLTILSEPTVAAVSMLRPRQSVIVFILNCVVSIGLVAYYPHANSLAASLQHYDYVNTFYEIPLSVLCVSYIGPLIWVISSNHAIIRADQADRHTRLAIMEAQLALAEQEQHRKLQQDLDELQRIIVRLASHPDQPVRIGDTNALRFVAMSLELLRKQAMQHDDEKRLLFIITQACNELRVFLEMGAPLEEWNPTGTVLDSIADAMRTYHPQHNIASLSSNTSRSTTAPLS